MAFLLCLVCENKVAIEHSVPFGHSDSPPCPKLRGDMEDRKTIWMCGFLHVPSRDIVTEWIMTYWVGRRPPTPEIQSQNISFFYSPAETTIDTYERRTQATGPDPTTLRCRTRPTWDRQARCSPTQAAVRLPEIDLEVNLGMSGCCRGLVERRWGRSRKKEANRSGVDRKRAEKGPLGATTCRKHHGVHVLTQCERCIHTLIFK